MWGWPPCERPCRAFDFCATMVLFYNYKSPLRFQMAWDYTISSIFFFGSAKWIDFIFYILNWLLSVSNEGHFRKTAPGLKCCPMGEPAPLLKQCCWHLLITDWLGSTFRRKFIACSLVVNENSLDWGNELWGFRNCLCEWSATTCRQH